MCVPTGPGISTTWKSWGPVRPGVFLCAAKKKSCPRYHTGRAKSYVQQPSSLVQPSGKQNIHLHRLICSLLCFCTADLFPIKIFNHLGARCCPSDLPSSWFDLYSLYFVQQTQSSEILISLGTGPGSSPLWFCGQRTRLPRPLMGL